MQHTSLIFQNLSGKVSLALDWVVYRPMCVTTANDNYSLMSIRSLDIRCVVLYDLKKNIFKNKLEYVLKTNP